MLFADDVVLSASAQRDSEATVQEVEEWSEEKLSPKVIYSAAFTQKLAGRPAYKQNLAPFTLGKKNKNLSPIPRWQTAWPPSLV